MLCMSNITAQHTTSSLESNFNFFYIADLIFMIDDYTLFYKLKSRYGHSRQVETDALLFFAEISKPT
jgi:hypothetical protein